MFYVVIKKLKNLHIMIRNTLEQKRGRMLLNNMHKVIMIDTLNNREK